MSSKIIYDTTGGGYEDSVYGSDHTQLYLKMRSEMLAGILEDTFGPEKSLRVLEVGCGTGLSLEYLSRLPAKHSLVGMDLSETMLRQAAEKAAFLDNPPATFLGDAFHLPFGDGTFDMVYATRFIHQFSQEGKKQLFAEFSRVVRAEGVVVLEFYKRAHHWLQYWLGNNRRERSKEEYLSHYPTQREVREILGGSFKRLPTRLSGARTLYRALGESLLRRMTVAARGWPLSLATNEYFVVARK